MTDVTQVLSLDEIKSQLQNEKLLIVAGETGLSYPTVNKLAAGETNNYSLDTLRRVSIYLNDKT